MQLRYASDTAWTESSKKKQHKIPCFLYSLWTIEALLSVSFAERKRFYQDVSVYQQSQEDGGQFGIHLDHRKLRTPLRKLFLVPSERLAIAVSQEWGAQGTLVQPSLMHITALCNTVIDDPHKRSVEQIIDSLMAYLQSDTIWYSALFITWMNLFLVIQYYVIIMYFLMIIVSGQLSQMTWLPCNRRSGTLSLSGLMRGKLSLSHTPLPPSRSWPWPCEWVSEQVR